MSYEVRQAKLSDMSQLLELYAVVYGNTYPIAFGFDVAVMSKTIQNPNVSWLVIEFQGDKKIVGSIVFERDPKYRIAKVEGLVVSPAHQHKNLGSLLLDKGMDELLAPNSSIHSVFATTRTQSIVVQRLFLHHKFFPLGVFPNSHRLREYETLTLFARYKQGVLEERAPVANVPCELKGILDVAQKTNGIATPTNFLDTPPPAKSTRSYLGEFEFIDAPHFVMRRFNEKVKDPKSRFFPFCEPNLLLCSQNGEAEIFAFHNKHDRYFAFISMNVGWPTLLPDIHSLLDQLRDRGVSYAEFLLPLSETLSIQCALEAGFVPSAFYPALFESEGKMHDYVILSYSLEPLDFRHMAVDRSFKHYMDHYVRQWTKKHIQGVEVLDAR